MRRRRFALIGFTALLFPSYPYRRPQHQPLRSCSSPFAFSRTVVSGHATVALCAHLTGG
jgi:hypothetical protein